MSQGSEQNRVARFDGFERSPQEPPVPADELDRVFEALTRTKRYLPAAAVQRLSALWDLDTFVAFVFLLCLWAGVQFTPIGWLADLALIAYGLYHVGSDVKALVDAAIRAKNAQTDAALEDAARVMAGTLTETAIDVIAGVLGGAAFSRLRKALRPVRGRLFPRLAGAVGGVALERGAVEVAQKKKEWQKHALNYGLALGGAALLTTGIALAVSGDDDGP